MCLKPPAPTRLLPPCTRLLTPSAPYTAAGPRLHRPGAAPRGGAQVIIMDRMVHDLVVFMELFLLLTAGFSFTFIGFSPSSKFQATAADLT